MTPAGLSHRHIFMRAKHYRIHPLTQGQKRSTKCQCEFLIDALYASKGRGFSGEIGLVTAYPEFSPVHLSPFQSHMRGIGCAILTATDQDDLSQSS